MTAEKQQKSGAGGSGKSFKIFVAVVLLVAVGLVAVWLKVVRGGQTDVNPNYLQPTRFRPPMMVRLGLEVGF